MEWISVKDRLPDYKFFDVLVSVDEPFFGKIQVSPDDWETITPTFKVTRETTVGEIMDWAAKNWRVGSVIIQELKTLKP